MIESWLGLLDELASTDKRQSLLSAWKTFGGAMKTWVGMYISCFIVTGIAEPNWDFGHSAIVGVSCREMKAMVEGS